MESFLTEHYLITPPIAGTLTMVAANVLAVQFSVPAKWSALGLSLLFALIVSFNMKCRKKWRRVLYLPINALIVFVVAAGTNGLGLREQQPDSHRAKKHQSSAPARTRLRHRPNWFHCRRRRRKSCRPRPEWTKQKL